MAPTGSEVAEGGAHAENNPTVTRLRRTPTIIHYPWSLSGNLSAMDEVGLGSLFENGVQGLILERATRAILSGPNTGNNFAANANSFDGLFASGVNLVAFGAKRRRFDYRLRSGGGDRRRKSASQEQRHWRQSVLDTLQCHGRGCGGQADRPGLTPIVFLAQRDPEKFREGLIGGTTAGLGSHYVESGELGRPHSTSYKRTAIGVVGFGSQMVPIFFGQGNRVPAKPSHRHHQHQLQPTNGALLRSGKYKECRGDWTGGKLRHPTKSNQRSNEHARRKPNPLSIIMSAPHVKASMFT